MGNEVGIIGQMYENRNTHKIGVLESRDEKYKTLLMRDGEGNTFNINFSTFKSSWRKYAGSEIIETSTQKEEKKSQKEEQAVDNNKLIKQSAKKTDLSQKEKVQLVVAAQELITDKVEAKGISIKVKQNYKGGIKLIYDRHNIFEVWFRYKEGRVTLCMKAEMVKFMPNYKDKEVLTYPDWTLGVKHRFDQTFFDERIDAYLEGIKKYIADCESKKKRAKKEAEEKKEEE